MNRIPEKEARKLWQRAIELQETAERKQGPGRALAAPDADGYSLQQIVEAAHGAGINPEYVRLAVAEARLPDAADFDRSRWTARWHRVLVGTADVLDVEGHVATPPARAVAAFRAVVATPAFALVLADRVGKDPPLDGVLVYRIDPPTFGGGNFHGAMVVADAKVILVTARPSEGGTMLRLRLPLREHGVNLGITGALATGGGAAGAAGGVSAGGALAAALGTTSLAVIAGPAVIGAVAGGVLGIGAFRSLSHWGRRKGVIAVRQLLQTVALEAEADSAADRSLPD
jgi:hypothetical protein